MNFTFDIELDCEVAKRLSKDRSSNFNELIKKAQFFIKKSLTTLLLLMSYINK